MSDFATSWTVAHQAPLSMGFSRQEYWSGVPLPSPGRLVVSSKTKHTVPSSNHTPWYLSKWLELMPTQTGMQMFITTLFLFAKTWKWPRWPSVGVNKLWSIQTVVCHWAIKRDALTGHEYTQRIFKRVLPNERGQSGKAPYCIIPTGWCSRKGKTMQPVQRSVDATNWEGGGQMGKWRLGMCAEDF